MILLYIFSISNDLPITYLYSIYFSLQISNIFPSCHLNKFRYISFVNPKSI